MSGTSAFLRRICWAMSDCKTSISTPFNFQVCEFESLIRGQEKFLLTEELVNSFLFISFLSESIYRVGFCSTSYIGSSRFATAGVFKYLFLLYTEAAEAGTRTIAPYQDEWLMTGGVYTFKSFNPFSDASTSLLRCQVFLFKKSNQILI